MRNQHLRIGLMICRRWMIWKRHRWKCDRFAIAGAFFSRPRISGTLLFLLFGGIELNSRYIRESLPTQWSPFQGPHASGYTAQKCYMDRIYELRFEIHPEFLLDRARILAADSIAHRDDLTFLRAHHHVCDHVSLHMRYPVALGFQRPLRAEKMPQRDQKM